MEPLVTNPNYRHPGGCFVDTYDKYRKELFYKWDKLNDKEFAYITSDIESINILCGDRLTDWITKEYKGGRLSENIYTSISMGESCHWLKYYRDMIRNKNLYWNTMTC